MVDCSYLTINYEVNWLHYEGKACISNGKFKWTCNTMLIYASLVKKEWFWVGVPASLACGITRTFFIMCPLLGCSSRNKMRFALDGILYKRLSLKRESTDPINLFQSHDMLKRIKKNSQYFSKSYQYEQLNSYLWFNGALSIVLCLMFIGFLFRVQWFVIRDWFHWFAVCDWFLMKIWCTSTYFDVDA